MLTHIFYLLSLLIFLFWNCFYSKHGIISIIFAASNEPNKKFKSRGQIYCFMGEKLLQLSYFRKWEKREYKFMATKKASDFNDQKSIRKQT